MAITAFTSTAIIDATTVGTTVLTASSEGIAADAIGLGATDDVTFNSVDSVDGSFSGNLVSEVGGSYKLYNLGNEGDADSEYLETSWDTNVAKIATTAAGTGVTRNLQFNCGTVAFMDFSVSQSSIRIRRPIRAYAAYNIGLSYERFNGGYFNRLDASISVTSVDGSFSGNMTLSNLPTSDPAVAGQLWNDSGTVKVSAG